MRFNHIIAWVVLLGTISTVHAVEEIPLVQFPAWGVAFCPPAEWGRVFTMDGKRMAHWQKVDGAGQPIAAVVVDAETVTDTLDANAEKFAKKYQMTSKEITLAGERAIELTNPQDKSEHVEIMMLVMRGKVLYQVIGFSNDGRSSTSAVILIKALWKWIEQKPQAESIEMSKPVAALNGAISLTIPKSSYISSNTKDMLSVGLYDVTRNSDDYRIRLSPMKREAGKSIDDLAASVIQYETFHKKTDPQPAWRKVEGSTPRMMTQPITIITPADEDEDGPVPEFRIMKMFAVIEASDAHAVQITFNFTPADEKLNHLFVAAAEKIIGSIVITDPTKFPQPKAAAVKKNIDAAPIPDTPVRNFPIWGVALSPPGEGWELQMSTAASQMATWHSGTFGQPDSAIISIYTNSLMEGGLEAQVKDWQTNFKGTRRDFVIDGEPAVELTDLVAKNGSKTELVVLVTHQKVHYSIVGTTGSGRSAKNNIAAICKSWKWTAIEPTAKHLELGPPMTVLNGKASITVPLIAHRIATADEAKKFSFGLMNVTTFNRDLFFSMETMPKKADVSAQQFAEQFIDQIRKEYETDPMPLMRDIPGATPRFCTQPFFVTAPEHKDADGKVIPANKLVVMYGVVGFGDGQVLIVTARLMSPSLYDNADFAKAVDKMVESIAITAKK